VALGALAVGGGQATAVAFNPDPVFPVGPISRTASHQIATLDHVASALAGRRAIVNCWSYLYHQSATISTGRIPKAITELSTDVRAYRQVWAGDGEKWNRDTILFDPTKRATATLFFKAPVGEIPLSLEVRATRAALNSLR
jgi:hypothetical protein